MRILYAGEHAGRYQIVTSTAKFVVGKRKISAFQIRDPDNQPCTRMVGEIQFKKRITPLVTDFYHDQALVGRDVRITISADGMCVVENIGPMALHYRWERDLGSPDWYRTHGNHIMVADRRGGYLLLNEGDVLMPHGRLVVAVLPSRVLDKRRLYGDGERPHVVKCYNYDEVDTLLKNDEKFDELQKRGFGALVLFSELYTTDDAPIRCRGGLSVYEYRDPGRVDLLIKEAHAHDFTVIAYLAPKLFLQHPNTTLKWMKQHQKEYELDGWYLDGSGFYRTEKWWENYQAIRQLRRDVGDNGIIINHNSVSTWGEKSGVISTPLDSWCDYQLTGEFQPLSDNYWYRAFSGCICDWKPPTGDGHKPTDDEWHAISREVGEWGSLGQGVHSVLAKFWDADFAPAFERRRAAWRERR